MRTRREVLKSSAVLAGMIIAGSCRAKTTSGPYIARYWQKHGDGVSCRLCPHGCILNEGKTGICRNRQNINGQLIALGYALPCAIHDDPIEKKPLYHMLPGSRSFSIAVAGCNLRCKNCQNHTISQTSPLESNTIYLPPQKVVDEAKQRGCSSISYTYSEPTVWFEYMYDTAKIARKAGLKNVLVSSGYINTEPLCDLSVYLDGANIDLKSFDEKLYRNLNAGSLKPILSTLQMLKEKGVWTEITNLVVPKWTDDSAMIKKMCHWIVKTIGNDVPIHFSRFFPLYKLRHLFPTPAKTLLMAKKIARKEGVRYVYVGNVPGVDSNTYCPNCGALQIGRKGYIIKERTIKDNACVSCGFAIAGVWT